MKTETVLIHLLFEIFCVTLSVPLSPLIFKGEKMDVDFQFGLPHGPWKSPSEKNPT